MSNRIAPPLLRPCRLSLRAFALLLIPVLLACASLQTHAQALPTDTLDSSRAIARAVPPWLSTAIVYEIFPRDFSAEGTLNGVTAKMGTLEQLGFNVLWIMPIQPIGVERRLGPLGSPYSIRDYYAIDPALGTKADFLRLVQAAHQHHMRVILDMVADHTSRDSVMMTHPQFYQHDAAGNAVAPHGWSDVAALNYDNPELRKYMLAMFAYWLKDFDLDGFRCDAAGFVPTSFWNQVREEVQGIRPDALLLAEASKPELMRHDFDLDYAWPLLATFDRVIEHGEPASAIREEIAKQAAKFPSGTQHMLISDDHDEQRATVRYGAAGAIAASALVFTLPGVPMLYNGMEVGDATPSSGPALFEKRPLYWGAAHERPDFPEFYRVMIPLRKSSPALRGGDLVWLHNSDEAHVLTYLRRSPEETELVAANLSNARFRGTAEIPGQGWQEVALNAKAKPGVVALPFLSLDPFQVRVFRLLTPHAQ